MSEAKRSECVGLSACVKHGHMVPSKYCTWLRFDYVRPSILTRTLVAYSLHDELPNCQCHFSSLCSFGPWFKKPTCCFQAYVWKSVDGYVSCLKYQGLRPSVYSQTSLFRKSSVDWMKGGWWNWSSQFLCHPVGSGFLKQLSQNTTFPQHERSEAERMRGPQRMR